MVETWIDMNIKNQGPVKSMEGIISETTDTPIESLPSPLLDFENSDVEKMENNNFGTEISPAVNTTGKIIKLLYKYLDYFMCKVTEILFFHHLFRGCK